MSRSPVRSLRQRSRWGRATGTCGGVADGRLTINGTEAVVEDHNPTVPWTEFTEWQITSLAGFRPGTRTALRQVHDVALLRRGDQRIGDSRAVVGPQKHIEFVRVRGRAEHKRSKHLPLRRPSMPGCIHEVAELVDALVQWHSHVDPDAPLLGLVETLVDAELGRHGYIR
jgi:hypothetical protein